MPHPSPNTITRRCFAAAALLAPPVFSWARLREEPAFPDWSDEYVDRLLTASPWARQFTARAGIAEFFPVLRWAGALAVRRALAVAQFGRQRAAEMVTPAATGGDIVVELGGIPTAMVRGDAARLEAELGRSARLYHPDRKPLAASEVHVPPHGMHLAATLRFPRWDRALTAADGEIGFSCEAAGARIDQRFKLRTMVYEGALVL